MNKISAVYKIVNIITKDCYVGSSKDAKKRWREHKWLSTWNKHPNSLLYNDMQNYGVDKFRFQILVPVMPEYLNQVEQELIDLLQPTYNDRRANGMNVIRHKESYKKAKKEYNSQPCSYNGETLTMNALACRFRRAGVEHPAIEAKKYLKNS